jgi:hypothetical protein
MCWHKRLVMWSSFGKWARWANGPWIILLVLKVVMVHSRLDYQSIQLDSPIQAVDLARSLGMNVGSHAWTGKNNFPKVFGGKETKQVICLAWDGPLSWESGVRWAMSPHEKKQITFHVKSFFIKHYEWPRFNPLTIRCLGVSTQFIFSFFLNSANFNWWIKSRKCLYLRFTQ